MGDMLVDFRQQESLAIPSDAVIVVGCGAAGLPLALTLADRGQPVVVVESGGEPHDVEASADAARLNHGVVSGLRFPLDTSRARVLGGTTSLWHGQCMRLHDIDVRERPWVPFSGWPLRLDQLSRHYRLAERWIGVSGRGYGPERWTEHPSLRPVDWTPEHLLHDFTEYTLWPQLGRHYHRRLVRHPLISTVVNATVSRVVTRDGVANGVEVVAHGGRRQTLSAARVVLAAGGIENARLLQLSDPEGVGLGLGRALTGRFLQTHPVIYTADVVPSDYSFLQDRYVVLRRGRHRIFPKVRLAPVAQEEHKLLDATAVFFHSHDHHGLQATRRLLGAARNRRRPDGMLRDTRLVLSSPASLMRDAYRRLARGLPTAVRPTHVSLEVWLEQTPDPDSQVTLSERRDALGLRQAHVSWRCDEAEIRTSRAVTRWIADDLERLGIAMVQPRPVMHDDNAWLAAVVPAAHPSGTTRMSRDPAGGVVDVDLQVHGVPGLFVLGGSVFPTSGYANPTLTIVALAMRLAEHLTTRVAATAR
jgi:choline dehydrogenase-like flavoprotein